jgi:uncharacterized RDD family membrane protein YckC
MPAVEATPTEHLAAGTRLAHYVVEEPLGEGAMGVVYRGHDSALDRPVAIKVLRGELTSPALLERFFREARAAARVNHPNLAHVYFVGQEAERAFFVMELLPGENLEQHVARRGPLPLGEAVDVLVQAARGLGAAHGAGVVHRDVKPSNVIRQPDGLVKVTDFGLARSLDAEVRSTQAGQVLGTPTYMSPEQCRGEEADARTDVYSLGLTGYFLLAGSDPFPGPGLGAVLNAQMNRPLPALREARTDLPAQVDATLARLAAKDAGDRPPDMRAAASLLETLRPRDVHPAPLAIRVVAALVDGLLALVLFAALMFGGLHLFGVDPRGDTPFPSEMVLGAVWLALNLGGEIWRGQSPGKWFFALEVVDAGGAPASTRQLVLRYLLRYPLFALGLSGITMLGPRIGYVAQGLEAVAILAALLVWARTRGLTLSDVVTRTRVAYRMRRKGPSVPGEAA